MDEVLNFAPTELDRLVETAAMFGSLFQVFTFLSGVCAAAGVVNQADDGHLL